MISKQFEEKNIARLTSLEFSHISCGQKLLIILTLLHFIDNTFNTKLQLKFKWSCKTSGSVSDGLKYSPCKCFEYVQPNLATVINLTSDHFQHFCNFSVDRRGWWFLIGHRLSYKFENREKCYVNHNIKNTHKTYKQRVQAPFKSVIGKVSVKSITGNESRFL